MAFEQRCPVILVCCGSFNPITSGHIKMFEIARNFLEKTGNHIVIGGVISPVHDSYGKAGLVSSTHRILMCKAAVQKHSWLSVDVWESSQSDWVKTVKVLQHISNKTKNDYGVPGPYSNTMHYLPAQYPRSAVTLQPNGTLNHQILSSGNYSNRNNNGFMCSSSTDNQESSLELNEASEPDKTGIVLTRLSNNLQKVCCVRPVPLQIPGNMVYGAAYDLRRTKVMLLCGGDLLESFGVSGLWSDEDIRELVTQYGIVCIPRNLDRSADKDGTLIRSALERLQKILNEGQGTVILVNDQRRADIAHISSTKCRSALKSGSEMAGNLLHPNVYNYIKKNSLYLDVEKCGG